MSNVPKLTREQAAIIGAYTGITVGPFGDVHEYAERILKRPVMTLEFASAGFAEDLRNATKPDLLAICREA